MKRSPETRSEAGGRRESVQKGVISLGFPASESMEVERGGRKSLPERKQASYRSLVAPSFSPSLPPSSAFFCRVASQGSPFWLPGRPFRDQG